MTSLAWLLLREEVAHPIPFLERVDPRTPARRAKTRTRGGERRTRYLASARDYSGTRLLVIDVSLHSVLGDRLHRSTSVCPVGRTHSPSYDGTAGLLPIHLPSAPDAATLQRPQSGQVCRGLGDLVQRIVLATYSS